VGTLDLLCAILRGSPRLNGACRHADAHWFDVDASDEQLTQAANVCSRCPVRQQCRDYADAQGNAVNGVYGGWIFCNGVPLRQR
jgi:hypothetical protein